MSETNESKDVKDAPAKEEPCGDGSCECCSYWWRENEENCRLLGMSGEREARHLSIIEELKKENSALLTTIREKDKVIEKQDQEIMHQKTRAEEYKKLSGEAIEQVKSQREQLSDKEKEIASYKKMFPNWAEEKATLEARIKGLREALGKMTTEYFECYGQEGRDCWRIAIESLSADTGAKE